MEGSGHLFEGGRLQNNFSDRVGTYSSGALIRGGAYSRIYGIFTGTFINLTTNNATFQRHLKLAAFARKSLKH